MNLSLRHVLRSFSYFPRARYCTTSNVTSSLTVDEKEVNFNKYKELIINKNPDFPMNKNNLKSLRIYVDKVENPRYWLRSIIVCPQLLKHNPEILSSIIIQCSQEFNLHPKNLWKLMSNNPYVAGMSLNKIRELLSNYIGFCSQYEINYQRLLEQLPAVLEADADLLSEQIAFLREFFTKTQISDLLVVSPSVLIENQESLSEKINYLYNVMHVHPDDITDSSALMYNLEFISQRYEFLNRAGMYKHPNPKGIEDSLRAFPLLKDIVDVDQQHFLEILCGGIFTENEFNIFKHIMINEEDKFFKYYDRDGYESIDYHEDYEEEIQFKKMGKKHFKENSNKANKKL